MHQVGRTLGGMRCDIFSYPSRGIMVATDAKAGWGFDLSPLPRNRRQKLVLSMHSQDFLSACCRASELFVKLRSTQVRIRVVTWVKSSNDREGDGDENVQDLLVDVLRLETGKMRLNEFVKDRSKFMTEIAEQANEEFDRIADEAKKTMDDASSKVLERVNAEADEFEKQLATARAEIEANERALDEFEMNVGKARSGGLFFKMLFATTKPWEARSPEEQRELRKQEKEVRDVLDQETEKAAGPRLRKIGYGAMICLLFSGAVEAICSQNVPWTRLSIFVLVLIVLVIQLIYEHGISTKGPGHEEN